MAIPKGFNEVTGTDLVVNSISVRPKRGTAGAVPDSPYVKAPGLVDGQTATAVHPWNVLTQNADPTGVAGSGAAINAAITGACIAGGAVESPGGTYSIDQQLVIGPNKGGILFLGEGKLGTIFVPTAALNGASSVLLLLDTRDNIVRDLWIKGTPGAAVDACIENNRDNSATTTTTGNCFYDLWLGTSTAGGGMNKGIKGVSTPNINDDLHLVVDCRIQGAATSCVSIENDTGLEWKIIAGQMDAAPVGIATAGGSFSALGISFEVITGWWVQLNAGTQRHASMLVNCSGENQVNGAFIQSAGAVAAAYVKATNCEGIFKPGNGGNLVDWQATASHLRCIGCTLVTGQGPTVNSPDAGSVISFTECELGVSTVTWGGHLRLRDNVWLPGSVTLTPSGAATKVQDGDVGGGFTSAGSYRTGIVLQYAGDTLIGNGLAAIVGQAFLSGQTASIAATDIYVPTAAGQYFAMVYVECTVAGTGGTVQAALVIRDDVSTYTQNVGGNLSLAATGRTSDHYFWRHNQASHIQFQTTVAGVTGSPQYRIVIYLLRFS